jgi:hypothetical protein
MMCLLESCGGILSLQAGSLNWASARGSEEALYAFAELSAGRDHRGYQVS